MLLTWSLLATRRGQLLSAVHVSRSLSFQRSPRKVLIFGILNKVSQTRKKKNICSPFEILQKAKRES